MAQPLAKPLSRRLAGALAIVSAAATGPVFGSTSVTTTVPRAITAPNRVTFTAGITDNSTKYVLNQTSQSLTTGSTAYATLAGVPVDLSAVMQWNAPFQLLVGQSGGVKKNDVVIQNVDFRGQSANGFAFTINGANVKFVNCLFDTSGSTYVNTILFNVNTVVSAGGRYPYMSMENCFIDGLNSSWYIRELIQGPIGIFRNNYLKDIPADIFLGPTTQDGIETYIEYNWLAGSLTACDGCTRILGTGTGVAWSAATDNVTLGSDFTVTTNQTGGATRTVPAGTYTIQQVIDLINGGTFGTSGTAATYTNGIEAYLAGPGQLAIMAYAYVSGANSSATRTITLTGPVSTLMGTGTSTSQSSLNWYARGNAYPYGRHAIPHADVLQISGSYAAAGKVTVRWNYIEMVPQLHGGTTAPSAYPNDPIGDVSHPYIYNYAGPTGDMFMAVDLSDMYCDIYYQHNDHKLTVGAYNIQNQSKSSKWTGAAPNNGKWRGLLRVTDCYFYNRGGLGFYRQLNSMNFQSSTSASWANPATFTSAGTDGDTITFWDGPASATYANSVTVTCAGGAFTAQQILTAINNANAAGNFRLEAYITGTGASSRLNIGSTRFVPSALTDQNKRRGNWLEIATTGTGSTAKTAFGLTGSIPSTPDFINPYSFERLWDYDTLAPIAPVLNGVGYESYNPLPSAPVPTVLQTGQTSAVVQFDQQTSVGNWQFSVNNGTDWSTLTTASSVVTKPDGSQLTSVFSGIATDPCMIVQGGLYRCWFSTYEYNGGSLRLGIAYATGTSPDKLTMYAIPSDLLADLVIKPSDAYDVNGCETVSVIAVGSDLWAYYSARAGNTYTIRRAVNTGGDGITWTKDATPCVSGTLSYDTAVGGFGGCLEPSVLWDGSQYRMWYVGWNGTAFSIMHATSADGVTWTKTATPVLVKGSTGALDDKYVSHVNVVAVPGGFRMFYHGIGTADDIANASVTGLQRGRIFSATSTDGITWTRTSTPVIAPRAWSCGGPSAVVDGNVIHLWYFDGAASYVSDLMYTVNSIEGKVTGTMSGLADGTAYTQCQVRGQNAINDLGEWKQNGAASANFTVTTESGTAAAAMAVMGGF